MVNNNRQNSKALRDERKKKINSAAYIGIAIACALIGIVGVIVWYFGTGPNYKVMQVGDTFVRRDVYNCAYYFGEIMTKDWSEDGFDINRNPYDQPLENANDDVANWGDYFEQKTENDLKLYLTMTDIAAKKGYSYSEKVDKNVQQVLSEMEEKKGTAKAFDRYMLDTYGSVISKKSLVKYLTLFYRAMEFYKKITENKALFYQYIGGDDTSFETTYLKNADAIDVVSIRYIAVEKSEKNADIIAALKNAQSEKTFQTLCNDFKNDEQYTQQDSSLYENISIASINRLSTGAIAKKLSSSKSKAGDVYFQDVTTDSEKLCEIVYVVKARGKDTSAYNDSEVAKWEFSAISVLLEEYFDNHYTLSVSQKGIDSFKKNMTIPITGEQ